MTVQSLGTTPAHRVRSFRAADFGIPSGREEEWRFTPLKRIGGLLDGSARPVGNVTFTSEVEGAIDVSSVMRQDPRLGRSFTPSDYAAAVAWENFAEALVVDVARESVGGQARIVIDGNGATAYGHVLVRAGFASQSTVIIEHSGDARYSATIEVQVEDGANLTLVTVQNWDRSAVHLGAVEALVGRDATFRSIVVSLGGDVVRIQPTVRYAGPGGDAQLLGVFFADDGQHLEHRSFVDHNEPHCVSDVMYKGGLQGAGSHTVWIGDVLVRREALGIRTYEINRNLVLSDGARADSVPNLELETGNVEAAGHASATGRLDDEQVFYLQSRGIDETHARQLVVRGFFADVVGRIGVPSVESAITAVLDARLGVDTEQEDEDE